MARSYFRQSLVVSQIDSTALASSTTPTSILPAAAWFTLPAGLIDSAGVIFKITAAGRVSNIVTSPGTLTLDVRFGSVVVANGGAMALNIVAKTNVPWWLEWYFTCRTIGGTTVATMIHQGIWASESVIGSPLPSAGGCGTHMLPNAAPAVGNGFDSTAAQQVNLFGTWSTNNAGNSIQTHQYCLELIN